MSAPRVALWGTFDVDNYGDHLFPRVAAHELGRRLPDGVVDAFAPYGWLRPTRLDGDRPASPLGPWSRERSAELAAAYDAVVIGGGEIIHLNDPLLATVYGASAAELARMAPSRFFVEALGPRLESETPVLWNAVGVACEPGGEVAERLQGALAGRSYVAVRDRYSEERLRRAGVEREIEIVPDSALLLDRVLPASLLRHHLQRLRERGVYPGRPALVIQGCDLLMPHVDAIAAALRPWWGEPGARLEPGGLELASLEPVVLETGRCRGDSQFADALARRLAPRRVWRLPADSTVEDLAAAIQGSEAFLGSSLHGAVTALVLGRPFVLLNLAGESKLDGFGDLTGLERGVVHHVGDIPRALEGALAQPADDALLARLQRRIDEHFDRMAEVARESAEARPAARPAASLDRYAVADHLTTLRTELAEARRRAAETKGQLAALKSTKTFRYTARARAMYERLGQMRLPR